MHWSHTCIIRPEVASVTFAVSNFLGMEKYKAIPTVCGTVI